MNVKPGGEAAVTISEALAGERLDKALSLVLAREIPGFSRVRARALIESGLVTLASSEAAPSPATITDPSHRVKFGQHFAIILPEPEAASPVAQAIPLAVAYEDDQLLVIDKPAGLVVHPAAGNFEGTLVNALLAHCGDSLSGIGGVRRPGIVHRIDKDTSGLMVVAKTDGAHAALAAQFAAHSLDRAYQAVVWGAPEPAEGEIEGAIGRDPRHRQRMTVVGRNGSGHGKDALTRYRTLRRFSAKPAAGAKAAVVSRPFASLVECRLATGRTHQIRVHMANIGHPLLGDGTYRQVGALANRRGSHAAPRPAAAETAAKTLGRQALHAYRIGFIHPTSHEKLTFESKLPSDLSKLISTLEQI
ncbi:MAG TPA: RluA family pseudouridine synthase [Alphaproteobacteria bacterium]|jgi:23S rRNA pseudouridine1911/1915/1917 synthase